LTNKNHKHAHPHTQNGHSSVLLLHALYIEYRHKQCGRDRTSHVKRVISSKERSVDRLQAMPHVRYGKIYSP